MNIYSKLVDLARTIAKTQTISPLGSGAPYSLLVHGLLKTNNKQQQALDQALATNISKLYIRDASLSVRYVHSC